jgi:cell division protease FtsH
MSDKLGPRTFGKRDELVFLGKEISEQRDYSDKVAEDIDDEVQNLIKTAYIKAKKTIEANSEKLRVVAEYLIKNETINGDKFHKLIAEN